MRGRPAYVPLVRGNRFRIGFLLVLGLGAALFAHAMLETVARIGWGAREYAAHPHGAFGPVAAVETALFVTLLGWATRAYLHAERERVAVSTTTCVDGTYALATGVIGSVAAATLFGMEYAECGGDAMGAGWLGGDLLVGLPILVLAIGCAIAVARFAAASRTRGIARLIAVIASSIVRALSTLDASAARVSRTFDRPLLQRVAPITRHGSLRAPPR